MRFLGLAPGVKRTAAEEIEAEWAAIFAQRMASSLTNEVVMSEAIACVCVVGS